MSFENFFTEPTTAYWQCLHHALPARYSFEPPHRFGYPVRLPCGRIFVLPLRQLPDPSRAVASFLATHASHDVISTLVAEMAALSTVDDDVVVAGLPTLGLAFAPLIAAKLGHSRYVPFGYSRKFWYDDALSEPVSSITSPSGDKRLRLDQHLLPLLHGKRVLLVDDAVSSGTTAVAAARLLSRAGVASVEMIVAMKQSNRWEADAQRHALPVRAVFGCPLFERRSDGWWPIIGSMPGLP